MLYINAFFFTPLKIEIGVYVIWCKLCCIRPVMISISECFSPYQGGSDMYIMVYY